MVDSPSPRFHGNLAERIYAQLLGFRNLRQRLSLLPVVTVLLVSLVTNIVLTILARDELYDSRAQLAHAFAEDVARHLSGEVTNVRDQMKSWAAHIGTWPVTTGDGRNLPDEFRTWLRSLGDHATSRFDVLALATPDGTVAAINDTPFGLGASQPFSHPVGLGTSLAGLVGEPDGSPWMRSLWNDDKAVDLPWRSIDVVNSLYSRPAMVDMATPDGVISRYQIVFTAPVKPSTSSRTTHALVAVASWAPFQRIVDEGQLQLERAGLPTGYGYLLDTGGERVIAHKLRTPNKPEAKGTGRTNLLGSRVATDNGLPHVAAAARAATGEPFVYEFPPGNEKFAVFVRVDPTAGQSDQQLDWRVAVGVDYSDIFAPLARLRRWFILATAVLTLAMLAVALWMRRSFTLSVREFAHLATEAAEGRFDLVRRTDSHDDISDLAAAMNRLFVSMRHQADYETLPNPYVVGTPVRSGEMFFGRQDDLRWITERLRQPGNELIVLYGQRRIGKTSLLHQVRLRREEPPSLPIFIDTHALLPSLRSDDDLYPVLGRVIARELLDTMDEPTLPAVRTAEELVAFLRITSRRHPGRPLVLMFDEFEALEQKIREGTLSSEISSFLAGLLETDCNLSIIATGSHDGSKVGGPLWGTLAPKALGRRIGLLSKADGMRLVRHPVADHVEFEDGAPERILRLTGSHPYYTQTVCQRIIDLLNESQTRRVSVEVVQTVSDQLLHEPPLPLDDMWSGASLLHKWVLAELGRLLPDPDSSVKPDAILVNDRFAPVQVVAELRRLKELELLEDTSSGYRFSVDFIRLWIRHQQLWWAVAQVQESAT